MYKEEDFKMKCTLCVCGGGGVEYFWGAGGLFEPKGWGIIHSLNIKNGQKFRKV